jgi:hypothetical protein
LTSATALAAPFGTYDPRSLAMGGVGVTTATARNANFFNPAMLAATRDDDDFALGLPIIAVGARTTSKDLVDDVSDLIDSVDALDAQLAAFANAPNQALAGPAAASLRNFDTALARVSNNVMDVDGFAGAIITFPSKSVGGGVHVGGRANFGARFNYAAADAGLLNTVATNLENCAAGNNAACTTAQGALDAQGNINGLQSTMQVRGLLVREVGVAAASRFPSLHDIDLGVTLKAQRIRSFDYVVSSQNSDIDFEQGQKDDNAVNVDIGATKTYGDAYKAGVVVKNLFKKDITTVLGNTIEMAPQVRLGVSHHRGWATFGADLDITRNKPVATGFDQETQFLALGAEFDAFGTLQLRLGYRHDLAGNYDGVPSIGLGFSPFGIHIDVAAAVTDKEVAGGLQLGFNF